MPPTRVPSKMFFINAWRRLSANIANVIGIKNMKGYSCWMVALHNSGNGQPVSSMSMVSAMPTAPNVVGSLLAMRLTSHVISNTCTLLSVEIAANCFFSISILPESNRIL